jgi:stress response protein YsnF
MADTPEDQTESISVPVIEEELEVGKRRVEGDRVSVRTLAREREELVEQPLESMEVEIERVVIDREIHAAPDVRNEGDTTIIPVVEERLIVEKRLFLREEIHVRRRRTVTRFRQNVTLRSQEVLVERRDAATTHDRTETAKEG